jgi:hypothetical protein
MTASNEERLRRVTEKVAMYLLDEEGDVVVKKAEELKPVTLAKVVDAGVEMVRTVSNNVFKTRIRKKIVLEFFH